MIPTSREKIENEIGGSMELFRKLIYDIILVLIKSLILYLLWGDVAVNVFKLPDINYLHSIGLVLISQVLFQNSIEKE